MLSSIWIASSRSLSRSSTFRKMTATMCDTRLLRLYCSGFLAPPLDMIHLVHFSLWWIACSLLRIRISFSLPRKDLDGSNSIETLSWIGKLSSNRSEKIKRKMNGQLKRCKGANWLESIRPWWASGWHRRNPCCGTDERSFVRRLTLPVVCGATTQLLFTRA